jgi:hypothetical protein
MKVLVAIGVMALLADVSMAAYFHLRGNLSRITPITAFRDVDPDPVSFPTGAITLAERTFASREEFIFSGGRCASRNMTDIERFQVGQMLAELPPESPTEVSRLRSVRVFIHILQSSTKQGLVADSAISSQMSVLNRAFREVAFTFTLAGVTRTTNDAWCTAGLNTPEERAMKRALRQGSYSDLNVYTTAQKDSTLGWATLPTNVGTDISFDGVVIDYRSMPGGNFFPYNEGQTLTHETGHWLGLEHTFQGGCAVDYTGGDQVADTPAEKVPNFGCPSDRTNSCPGNVGGLAGTDPIHNYMDYTDDSCMDNFTREQGARARAKYRLFRSG